MSRFLHEPVPPPHACEPPDAGPENSTFRHRVGTVWECDCGVIWIVRWIPVKDYGRLRCAAHAAWHRESPRERRQRLGISPWRAALVRLGVGTEPS